MPILGPEVSTTPGSVKVQETSENNPNIDMTLDNLVRENSWLYCIQCSFYSKSEKGLILHIVRIHDKVEPCEADLVSCLEFYQCTLCDFRCANNNASWYGFKRHVIEKHAEVDAGHFDRHRKKITTRKK